MHKLVMRLTIALGAIVGAACVYDAPVKPDTTPAESGSHSPSMQLTAVPNSPKSYIIDFTGNALPADLAAQVEAAGGTVTRSIGQIGVAVAVSDNPSFAKRAERIRGVFSVIPDIEVQWLDPKESVAAGEDVVSEDVPQPEALVAVGAAETFRLVQWAP